MKITIEIFGNFERELNKQETVLLFICPLIQTAWECEAISPRERQVIFKSAREDGIDERSDLNNTLNDLLKNQPSQEFFEECLLEIKKRLLEMTVISRKALRARILSRCREVAESAGGKSLMDINHHISDRELDLLANIHDTLH